MQIAIQQEVGFAMLDVLVERRKNNQYPYNRPDAVIPQKIIPKELRKNKYALACFYFYVCIYMRGGIESLQAFNALISMRHAHPDLFDPYTAQWWSPEDVQTVLKEFIGWDSKSASISWVENSRRLMRNWGGNPLNLIKGLRDYDEALRRIKNKTTKRALREAGAGGEGFRGFQPKMVSMLLYFYDWENWFEVRFLYPSPADFHNFRLGIANGAIIITLEPGETLSASEKLSAPWRAMVIEYLRVRKADPLEVSDAIWLFSLVNCGNSPLTVTRGEVGFDLFAHAQVSTEWDEVKHEQWLVSHWRVSLSQTCLICPFNNTCTMAIPAQPYYRRGKLLLKRRPRVEQHIDMKLLREPRPEEVVIDQDVLQLLHNMETPVPA